METLCVTAKGEPDRNEDRLVVNDRFVAVIDGATSSKPINGKSGGIVAAQALADVFSEMEANATARDFVNRATTELSRRIGDWPDPQAMRPAAAFVAYSVLRREIWRVGDCHFRIDDREFSGEKEIDRVAYAFRCAVVRARIALGASSVERETSVATLEQPFMPLVEVQHAYCNIDAPDPLAYGAIDGRRVPDRYIEVYDARFARDVVLCSDGFLRPFATLAEGLEDLSRLRAADPLMAYKCNGSRPFPLLSDYFDDTTYLRFCVSA